MTKIAEISKQIKHSNLVQVEDNNIFNLYYLNITQKPQMQYVISYNKKRQLWSVNDNERLCQYLKQNLQISVTKYPAVFAKIEKQAKESNIDILPANIDELRFSLIAINKDINVIIKQTQKMYQFYQTIRKKD